MPQFLGLVCTELQVCTHSTGQPAPDLRKHCARGGTRTRQSPFQTLGSRGNMRNPAQSDAVRASPAENVLTLSTRRNRINLGLRRSAKTPYIRTFHRPPTIRNREVIFGRPIPCTFVHGGILDTTWLAQPCSSGSSASTRRRRTRSAIPPETLPVTVRARPKASLPAGRRG